MFTLTPVPSMIDHPCPIVCHIRTGIVLALSTIGLVILTYILLLVSMYTNFSYSSCVRRKSKHIESIFIELLIYELHLQWSIHIDLNCVLTVRFRLLLNFKKCRILWGEYSIQPCYFLLKCSTLRETKEEDGWEGD